MKNLFRFFALSTAAVILLSMTALAAPTNYFVAADFSGGTNAWVPNDPSCQLNSIGNGFFSLTINVPAGSHGYKISNGTWDTDGCWGVANYTMVPAPAAYGLGGIPLTMTESKDITFYFNENTKKVADSTYYTMVKPYVVGTFLTASGLGTDWDASTAKTLLTDDNFDNIYTGTFAIPAGTYSTSACMDQSWTESYGIDGKSGIGTGISFTVPTASNVTFTYNAITHITRISIGDTVISTGKSATTSSAVSSKPSSSSSSKSSSKSSSSSSKSSNVDTGDSGLMFIPLLVCLAAVCGTFVFKSAKKKV